MKAEIRKQFEKEVKNVADAIVNGDNLGVYVNSDDMVYLEWKAALDKAFDIIAKFADKNGIYID